MYTRNGIKNHNTNIIDTEKNTRFPRCFKTPKTIILPDSARRFPGSLKPPKPIFFWILKKNENHCRRETAGNIIDPLTARDTAARAPTRKSQRPPLRFRRSRGVHRAHHQPTVVDVDRSRSDWRTDAKRGGSDAGLSSPLNCCEVSSL